VIRYKKPILITPGEPLGIGPDIVIKLTQKKLAYPYKIIADPALMLARAEKLKLKFNTDHLIPVKNSKLYVLECLKLATKLCLEKKAAALITGPVNKKMINNMGIKFQGHTQYLAKLTKTKEVAMFFESPSLKLALVTDHLALSEVSANITPKRLSAVITLLEAHLKKYYNINTPRIAVCGLNPHAGEGGILGQEEIKVITPTIQLFQKKHFNITGPHSADSLFYDKNLKKYDAVIAMYHDQGLSVLKHRDFGKAINITLGLPFLRTSVDHGTAIELAGTGKASADNLEYVFAKTVELLHAQTP